MKTLFSNHQVEIGNEQHEDEEHQPSLSASSSSAPEVIVEDLLSMEVGDQQQRQIMHTDDNANNAAEGESEVDDDYSGIELPAAVVASATMMSTSPTYDTTTNNNESSPPSVDSDEGHDSIATTSTEADFNHQSPRPRSSSRCQLGGNRNRLLLLSALFALVVIIGLSAGLGAAVIKNRSNGAVEEDCMEISSSMMADTATDGDDEWETNAPTESSSSSPPTTSPTLPNAAKSISNDFDEGSDRRGLLRGSSSRMEKRRLKCRKLGLF